MSSHTSLVFTTFISCLYPQCLLPVQNPLGRAPEFLEDSLNRLLPLSLVDSDTARGLEPRLLIRLSHFLGGGIGLTQRKPLEQGDRQRVLNDLQLAQLNTLVDRLRLPLIDSQTIHSPPTYRFHRAIL